MKQHKRKKITYSVVVLLGLFVAVLVFNFGVGSVSDIGELSKKAPKKNTAINSEKTADSVDETGTDKPIDIGASDVSKSKDEERISSTDNASTSPPDWEDTLDAVEGDRLEWSPTPILEIGKVFDLCNDDQAIEAGMDGGDLVDDRERMGIDCVSSDNRYGLVSSGGEILFSNTEDVVDNVLIEDDEGALPAYSAMSLGYQGPRHADVDISSLDVGNVVVLPDSLSTNNGVTYGLIANTSNDWAHSVSVQIGGAYYEHPLSLQPGETAPFSIETFDAANVESDATINASLTKDVDINRSILVTGAPGNWVGEIQDLPAPEGMVDLSQHSGIVRYYQTNLEIVKAVNQTTGVLRSIENIEVVVSFFNESGSVMGIIKPQPMRVDVNGQATHQTTLNAGDMLTIGFILPSDAMNFGIWVGGST